MCLIVDANVAGIFLARSSAIRKWLGNRNGDPRLVADGKLKSELVKIQGVRRYLDELERAGKLRSFSKATLLDTENSLRKSRKCVSNDVPVVALVIVSGARTIATMDGPLAEDIKNQRIINNPPGSVYRDPAKHRHLLRHISSCGVG